jgi:hypothetical protein
MPSFFASSSVKVSLKMAVADATCMTPLSSIRTLICAAASQHLIGKRFAFGEYDPLQA